MKYLVFYGNLYECPWGERLKDCPVKVVSDLTFEEKFKWFNNLPDQQKNDIIAHHNHCSKVRAMNKVSKTPR